MDQTAVLLALSIPVLLTGCNPGEAGGEQGAAPMEQVQADGVDPPIGGAKTGATLGPIHYEFDPTQLLMAEVLVRIPPDRDEQVWAAKLIAFQRADMLGQDLCQYEQSGRLEMCDAQKEPGLALALLARPLTDYREAFVRNGLEDKLSTAELDGSRGFTFTAQAGRSRIEYHFLPLQDRTVLVARRSIAGQDLGAEAIRDVIRSFEEGLRAAHTDGTG